MRHALIALTLTLAGPALAEDPAPGEELYLSRCGACHGVAARGDGPMAALLTIPVPDLTQLAVRNGGMFPRADVVRAIDGRLSLVGHGGPMPVFGRLLGGGSAVIDGPDGSVIQTKGDVVAIARHIEELQAE
ncbi:MAG: c-type cytochrome [Rhodobacter sp.]|nr:c-type cytochrome [Rhodobacter sp.]